MTFLPESSVLLTYSLACFVLFITPGPDMSLFLAKTMAGGRKAGIASMLGAMVGCCVHTLLGGPRRLGPSRGLGDGLHGR